MFHRRVLVVILVALLLLSSGSVAVGASVDASEPFYHRVRAGETLFSIALMYKVSMQDIIAANNLTNPRLIYVGQRLRIPISDGLIVHIVRRGETLIQIALRYGVSTWSIVSLNRIRNPNLLYVGQRLVIPQTGPVTPTPVPSPQAPVVQEAIVITSPAMNEEITSPVTVRGWGSGFENTLAVDILDENGAAIGQGYAMVEAEFGQYGPFEGVIEFTKPAQAQTGRIHVYSISPRDGAIEHLNSVTVTIKP